MFNVQCLSFLANGFWFGLVTNIGNQKRETRIAGLGTRHFEPGSYPHSTEPPLTFSTSPFT
jgi:hypothetical protein